MCTSGTLQRTKKQKVPWEISALDDTVGHQRGKCTKTPEHCTQEEPIRNKSMTLYMQHVTRHVCIISQTS